ncbi:hypothetical protein DFJ77DRAFT_97169 [Powellomyces hirtus]|nr:hypothetical protein DFJ77DRAFT_97169 [Powellomyces hirtus]
MHLSLITFAATVIVTVGIPFAAASTPLGLHRRRDVEATPQSSNCSSWTILQDRDLKDIADLNNHPIWNKKFPSACACAAAIASVTSPRAPLFAWNPKTTGCYPKGMSPYTNQQFRGTLQIPVMTWEYATEQEDLKGVFNGEEKVCYRFAIPRFEVSSCGEICAESVGYGLCDFSITAQLRGESQYFCSLCKFQAVKGQVVGYRTNL